MLFLTLLIIFIIVLVIAIFMRGANNDSDTRDMGMVLLIGAPILFLALTVFNSFTTVEPGHVKVGKLFGKPVAEYTSGFSWLNPFYDLVTYDGRVQEYTRSGRSGEGANDGYDAIEATTKNNMEVYIEETIKWRLTDGNFTLILQNVGDFDDVVDKFVRPDISEVNNKITAKFLGNSIVENRDSVQNLIHAELRRKWAKDNYITLVSTDVRDIDLPDEFKKAVLKKLASVEQITTDANLALAKEHQGNAVLKYQRKIAEAQKLGQKSAENALEWKRLDVLDKLVTQGGIKWGIVQMNENGTPLFINPGQ